MKHFRFSFRLLAVVLAVAMSASMAQAGKIHWIVNVPLDDGFFGDKIVLTEEPFYSSCAYEFKMSDEPVRPCWLGWDVDKEPGPGPNHYIYYVNLFGRHPGVSSYTCYQYKEYDYSKKDAFRAIVIFGGGESAAVAYGTLVLPGTFAESGEIVTSPHSVSVSLGDDDSADPTGGSITMVSVMDADALSTMLAGGVASTPFLTGYKGMYFKLPAGKGRVELDIKTTGDYSLGVTKGTEFVGSYTKTDKGTVTIDYDLTEETMFYAYPKSTSTTGSLEIYSLKVVPDDVNLTLNSDNAGSYWATFYTEAAGYTADAQTTVYKAKLSADNKQLELTEVADKVIPAGNAVILKSATAGSKLAYNESATGTLADNVLKGSSSVIATPANAYMLVNGKNGVGFYRWESADIPAGKAYIVFDSSSSAGTFIPMGDNSTTDISTTPAAGYEKSGLLYDLSGRKANEKLTPGIYVRNGNKVVVK